ncbi:hypothetical protein J6590_073423 [Homalodisca vitripennis]|nr:hypothetical protein J6590_073423 [Homalodisca vitripennis]
MRSLHEIGSHFSPFNFNTLNTQFSLYYVTLRLDRLFPSNVSLSDHFAYKECSFIRQIRSERLGVVRIVGLQFQSLGDKNGTLMGIQAQDYLPRVADPEETGSGGLGSRSAACILFIQQSCSPSMGR